MFIIRILLLPFSVLYGLGIVVRNFFYKSGVLNSIEFDIPIICVGNISFGGTGKTPHIEYLIELLKPHFRPAVLSRGYKRKTKGYCFADENADASTIGDEPFQVKTKYTDVAVGVSENRVLGVPDLLRDAPDTQIILMDDGFQHRAITAGLNIILTEYSNLFYKDFIAPSGSLREFRSAYKRAKIIVVTKCPESLSQTEREKIISEMAPQKDQKVFFSYLTYQIPVGLFDANLQTAGDSDVLLFAGIANISKLEEQLRKNFHSVTAVQFYDHKNYFTNDIESILRKFSEINSQNKILITTEKDAVKLRQPELAKLFNEVRIFYQPVKVKFFEQDENEFNKTIFEYVAKSNL